VSDTIATGAHEKPARGMPVQVLVARHPQVQANLEGRFVGVGESPFTPLGERQCAELVAYIAAWRPSGVHSSPRLRARSVADLVASLAGVDVFVDDDLAEIDFGAAEGLTFEEAKRNGVDIDLLGGPPESAPFRDGETWRSFAKRIDAAADRIERYGPRIAVVAHGGTVRSLIAHWLGLPDKAAWRFAVPNASVATLTLWDRTGTLRTFGFEPAGETDVDTSASASFFGSR
jgi:broad specificity phosphatase PhoE